MGIGAVKSPRLQSIDLRGGTAVVDSDPLPAPSTPRRPRGRARIHDLQARSIQVWQDRRDILAVIAAGGAIGSLARWQLTVLLPHHGLGFPWATFWANVTGCLLLGVLMVFVLDVWPPSRYLRPFLGVGVLGGYTTFSTYTLDARGLLVGGRAGLAGLYLLTSLAGGMAAVWLGATLARLAIGQARQRLLDRSATHPAPIPAPDPAPAAGATDLPRQPGSRQPSRPRSAP